MNWLKRRRVPLSSSWGLTLLGVWLICVGVSPMLGMIGKTVSELMNILAIAAGVLLLLQR